jgi:CRP-like cAMP-binding protein
MVMGNRFVEKLRGFAELSAADIAAIEAAISAPRRYAPKQDLIREGDQPGPVFVVLEGWTCRYKILPSGTRQITAFLMPGDCCDLHVGMLAAMDHSIQAITTASIATVQRADMDALMEGHPNVARAMYIGQLVDEGTLRAWIVSMGRRSSLERVAHLMCELYLRARGVGRAVGGGVALPLSQIVLADALGMTPVHINRILKELRLAGAMEIRRGSLDILDPVKLVQIAGFDENYLHRRLRQRAVQVYHDPKPQISPKKSWPVEE